MERNNNYKGTGRQAYGYGFAFTGVDEGAHYLSEPELRYGRRTVSRYVNILMDKWFKKIFGAERNREALVGILRELLPERSIVSIQYGRKPMRKNSPFKECHDAYFDVECTDSSGARFIVEMQVAEQRHFHERALFYATFPIQEQVLSRSRKRPALPHDLHFDYAPVYVISFLNFSFHPQDEQIVYRYDIRERYTDELMTDRLNFLFVEMPNAGEEEPQEGDSFTKKLSWAFRHMTALTERPAGLVGEIFERIFEACEVAKLSDEEFNQYNEESMTKWDYDDIVNTAWLKGEAAGRANGLEEGREKALEAVRARLRALGMDPAVIEEVAGEVENRRYGLHDNAEVRNNDYL